MQQYFIQKVCEVLKTKMSRNAITSEQLPAGKKNKKLLSKGLPRAPFASRRIRKHPLSQRSPRQLELRVLDKTRQKKTPRL
jgi:hypothetical protein